MNMRTAILLLVSVGLHVWVLLAFAVDRPPVPRLAQGDFSVERSIASPALAGRPAPRAAPSSKPSPPPAPPLPDAPAVPDPVKPTPVADKLPLPVPLLDKWPEARLERPVVPAMQPVPLPRFEHARSVSASH